MTTAQPTTLHPPIGQLVLEGWMLKKKRKKMQGFARRYFYLTSSPPTLSYSFSPQSRIRDSVYITLASISISRRSKSIHIDSGGSVVMHIKTLSDHDFSRWTDALKSFVSQGSLKEHERRHRHRKAAKDKKASDPTSGPSLSLGLNLAALNALRPLDMSTIYQSVSRMQAPLVTLETAQTTLRDLLLAHPESPPPNCDTPSGIPTTPTVSPNLPGKGKKPHLFRHHTHGTPSSSLLSEAQRVLKTIDESLSELRTEHLNLVNLLNAHSSSIKNQSVLSLTASAVEPRHSDASLQQVSSTISTPSPTASPSAAPTLPAHEVRSTIPPSRPGTLFTSDRDCRAVPIDTDNKSDSNDTESDLTFHDATSEEGIIVDLDAIHPGHEAVEEAEFDSPTSGTSSDDSDTESSNEGRLETKVEVSISPSGHGRSDSVHTVKSMPVPTRSASLSGRNLVKRRTELPAPVCGDEFSVFAMLRKNVGKDLSQISFPISFNEPLSALQKLCEECEYADQLLTRAARTADPIDRLVYISAFAVSAFCSTKTRAIRKPFNPMLGETYECVRPDKGMRFISEKVSHHPPIMAAYAEGEGWKLEMTSSVRQKFWGKSLEVIPEGTSRLTVFEPLTSKSASKGKDRRKIGVYHWDKPSSFVRNLMSGTKYLEHIGKVTVVNDCGPEKSTVEFKPGTTFGGEASRNKVEIKVFDSEGQLQSTVEGKWDTSLLNAATHEMVFEPNRFPERCADFYGFTRFAIELNETTPDIVGRLPPTDSRLRPDQRLFEEGKVAEAEGVKGELEEKQRLRRRKGENSPVWFEKLGADWVYKGGYFETRDKDPPEWKSCSIFQL